jgi:hypothetical protein
MAYPGADRQDTIAGIGTARLIRSGRAKRTGQRGTPCPRSARFDPTAWGGKMTAKPSVACGLQGQITFLDLDTVESYPPFDVVLDYEDSRFPGTRVHFNRVGWTPQPQPRWFLCGYLGIDRWFDAMRGRDDRLYIEVEGEQVAAWFIKMNRALPPELADVVSRHSGQSAGKGETNDPTTGDNRQGAGKASKAKGKTEKPLTLDNLTKTAWKLLETLEQLKATTVRRAVTRERIAAEAGDVGNADSGSVRAAFKTLADMGLIATKRNVGTWITQAGLDALKRHR